MSNFATESSRWYDKDGNAINTVPKKSGGERKATLADAKKCGYLPSVTTILQAAAKPALDRWKQRNAIIAALTTPRIDGENEDAFAERVLSQDVNSISDAAKDKGTAIHGGIEKALNGEPYDESLSAYVLPVLDACKQFGGIVAREKAIVGDGYAGKMDAIFINGDTLTVVDFKTCSALPKAQYDEHLLQLAAYAYPTDARKVANIYISTAEAGKIAVMINPLVEWLETYHNGFVPLLKFWRWRNNFA